MPMLTMTSSALRSRTSSVSSGSAPIRAARSIHGWAYRVNVSMRRERIRLERGSAPRFGVVADEGVDDEVEAGLELVGISEPRRDEFRGHAAQIGISAGLVLAQHLRRDLDEILGVRNWKRFLLQRESIDEAVDEVVGPRRLRRGEVGGEEDREDRVVVGQVRRTGLHPRLHQADGPRVTS